MKQYPKDALVYIDESGIESYFHRAYAWSKIGHPVLGEIPGKRFAGESFVAVKCGSNIFAPLCCQGTCNTKLFDHWVEYFLVPELTPGQVVILDNPTFHKSAKTRILI